MYGTSIVIYSFKINIIRLILNCLFFLKTSSNLSVQEYNFNKCFLKTNRNEVYFMTNSF